jgi:uncharacterized protein
MQKIDAKHIPAQKGIGFVVKTGQIIRVIDPQGGQVADFIAFNPLDKKEWLSTGATLDNNMSLFVRKGDALFSNKYNKMLTVVEDKVGKHDILYPACSPGMYKAQYNVTEYHPSCWENLTDNLKKLGVDEVLPIPFNIFQNSHVDNLGKLNIEAPISKPGDYIDLKVEMDLIVAISACSVKESACNSFKVAPIDVEIYQE